MREWLIGVLVLAISSGTAEAWARRPQQQTGGASASYGCTANGSTTLDLAIAANPHAYVVSLSRNSIAALQSGQRRFSIGAAQADGGDGSAVICSAGVAADCRATIAQLAFTETELRAGGGLAGTATIEGQTIPFRAAAPDKPVNCR